MVEDFKDYDLSKFLEKFNDIVSYANDLVYDRDSGLNDTAIDDIQSRIQDIVSEIESVPSPYGRR